MPSSSLTADAIALLTRTGKVARTFVASIPDSGLLEYSLGSDWGTVHDASTATAGGSAPSAGPYVGLSAVGITHTPTQYTVTRSFLAFDTSDLGDDITIVAAILRVKGGVAGEGSNGIDVSVLPGTQSNPLVLADFDAFTSPELGYIESWSEADFNNILLNASGLAHINKTGVTKFCLMERNHDFADTPPAPEDGNFAGLFYPKTGGADTDPELVVYYEGPASADAVMQKTVATGASCVPAVYAEESKSASVDSIKWIDGYRGYGQKICRTPDGVLHMIWVNGSAYLQYAFSINDGQSWTIERLASDATAIVEGSTIAALSDDRVAVASTQRRGGEAKQQIYVAVGSHGSWGSWIKVHTDLTGYHQYSPRIASGPNDILHLIWEDSSTTPQGIVYVYSTDSGGSWSARERLDLAALGTDTSRGSAIAVDRSGWVHILFGQTKSGDTYGGMWHRRRNPDTGAWSSPIDLGRVVNPTPSRHASTSECHLTCGFVSGYLYAGLEEIVTNDRTRYARSTTGGASWEYFVELSAVDKGYTIFEDSDGATLYFITKYAERIKENKYSGSWSSRSLDASYDSTLPNYLSGPTAIWPKSSGGTPACPCSGWFIMSFHSSGSTLVTRSKEAPAPISYYSGIVPPVLDAALFKVQTPSPLGSGAIKLKTTSVAAPLLDAIKRATLTPAAETVDAALLKNSAGSIVSAMVLKQLHGELMTLDAWLTPAGGAGGLSGLSGISSQMPGPSIRKKETVSGGRGRLFR
jgi:hypothetical protein